MGVIIRLARGGTKSKPRYRVVVADSRFPKEGRKIEILGSFNPFDKEKGLKVDAEKVVSWIKKGAKPSNTLNKIFKKARIIV